jgi:flagellar L-ring protein precursor FlgH
MSVIVREVTPSGQLVVEGTRSLVTNRETQTLVLSGIVRRDDIRADNTVLSTNLADAEIRMEGKGLIADRQRRGILTQIMDWLF